MAEHIFVDETKAGGYVMAASVHPPRELQAARAVLRGLLLRGQRRVHFTKENDRRRKAIVSAIVSLGVEVSIYDASAISDPRHARAACLEGIVADAATRGAQRLVLEQDDSLLHHDQRLLFVQTRKAGCADTLVYEHLHSSGECLLWVPDAVAWCWAKGGDWQRRVKPIVSTLRRV